MLAEILRAYKDTAIEKNDGFLFQPCSMACRKSRRPRATMALLRPGPCPHENAFTRRAHRAHARASTQRKLTDEPE
eukprot:COSAG02_NODE_30763_length_545_cov_2.026906_2_plen_76_part_00